MLICSRLRARSKKPPEAVEAFAKFGKPISVYQWHVSILVVNQEVNRPRPGVFTRSKPFSTETRGTYRRYVARACRARPETAR